MWEIIESIISIILQHLDSDGDIANKNKINLQWNEVDPHIEMCQYLPGVQIKGNTCSIRLSRQIDRWAW